MPKLGEVYYLAPQEGDRVADDKGDRPYVVLSTSVAGDGVVTMAYCSTRPTEARHGAAHVRVDPASTPDRRCGFSRPTYVYPSRLSSYQTSDLGSLAGRLVAELPAVRSELLHALGFGTGVRTGIEVPRGSVRGAVVQLREEYRAVTAISTAIIVTEPTYSRYRRQQTLVPLLADDEFERGALDWDVTGATWLRNSPLGEGSVFVATSLVTTVFEPDWIAGYTSAVVDPATMEAVETALALHFGLPAVVE